MGMPWVKLYVDMLDDAKVGFLGEGAQLLFIKLLMVAGECDCEGYLANGTDPMTRQQLTWRLRMSATDFDEHLDELIEATLIETDEDGLLLIVNFQKRQGRTQSEKRAQWRERKRKQRGTDTVSRSCPDAVTRDTPVTHAGVTPLEGEKTILEGEGEKTRARLPANGNPDALRIYYEETNSGLSITWQERVEQEIDPSPKELSRWRAVIVSWLGKGWKPGNVEGMLDHYKRGAMPGGDRTAPKQATGPPSQPIAVQLDREPEWMQTHDEP